MMPGPRPTDSEPRGLSTRQAAAAARRAAAGVIQPDSDSESEAGRRPPGDAAAGRWQPQSESLANATAGSRPGAQPEPE